MSVKSDIEIAREATMLPIGEVAAALGLALFTFVTTVLLGYFLGQGEFPHE